MNKVEVLFLDRAIKRAGVLLFSKKDTLDFIEQCEYYKIVILGIDGFFISKYKTLPSMEDSIDYSSSLLSDDIYKKAIEFVNERNDSLHFEIICG